MPDFATALAVYLFMINAAAVFPVIIDKRRAKQGHWRVPEAVFFWMSALGGTCGTYLTMITIRHKTKHKRFMIGLPLIFAAHMLLAAALLWLFFR